MDRCGWQSQFPPKSVIYQVAEQDETASLASVYAFATAVDQQQRVDVAMSKLNGHAIFQ